MTIIARYSKVKPFQPYEVLVRKRYSAEPTPTDPSAQIVELFKNLFGIGPNAVSDYRFINMFWSLLDNISRQNALSNMAAELTVNGIKRSLREHMRLLSSFEDVQRLRDAFYSSDLALRVLLDRPSPASLAAVASAPGLASSGVFTIPSLITRRLSSVPTPPLTTPVPGTSATTPFFTPVPSAPGTPAPGTPAPGTPVPSTPIPGTPVPGTPAPGTPVSSAAPVPAKAGFDLGNAVISILDEIKNNPQKYPAEIYPTDFLVNPPTSKKGRKTKPVTLLRAFNLEDVAEMIANLLFEAKIEDPDDPGPFKADKIERIVTAVQSRYGLDVDKSNRTKYNPKGTNRDPKREYLGNYIYNRGIVEYLKQNGDPAIWGSGSKNRTSSLMKGSRGSGNDSVIKWVVKRH